MKEKILENLGFKVIDDNNLLMNLEEYYGIKPEYVLDCKFSVLGDHCDDCVEFYYLKDFKKKGFYYSSSLFDTFNYGEHKDKLKRIVNKIKKYILDSYEINSKKYNLKLDTVSTPFTTWFFIECDLDNELYARRCLEKLTKVVIVLDYLMQNYENGYYRKNIK